MNNRLFVAELALILSGLGVGFMQNLNVFLQTFALLVTMVVGVLTTIKLVKDLKKKAAVKEEEK